MTHKFYVIRYRNAPECKGTDEYLLMRNHLSNPVTVSMPEDAKRFESRRDAEEYLMDYPAMLKAPNDHKQMADVAQVVVEKSVRVS